MVGLADPHAVDGGGPIGTRMPVQQFAKLAYRHVTTAPQDSQEAVVDERIVQGFASLLKAVTGATLVVHGAYANILLTTAKMTGR